MTRPVKTHTPLSNIGDYYNHVQNSTFLQNVNSGVSIPDPNKTASGLFFNTGQLGYNNQLNEPKPINQTYAESSNVQSNIMNIKNQFSNNNG